MFFNTSVLGSNGNSFVLKKSGPVTQLLGCKSAADIPRVPASAGLSLEAMWFYWSTLVCSKNSHTLFAPNIGCLLVELSHCKTVVLSVHIKTLLTCTVRARQMSCFNRAASKAACSSSFGSVITFIGATRALPRTNASSFWGPLELVTRARRNATALNTSCELSPNMCSCSQVLIVSGKVLLGIVISASLDSSTLHSRNLSTVSFFNSSSQCCPLTRQMSFGNNRAPTINGATRPMGSNTLDNRLKTKRYVKDLFTVLEVPRLTTRVSLL